MSWKIVLNKPSKIFISRKLKEDSIFFTLTKEDYEIIDLPLISIKPINFNFENVYDWVFFYSKNGIRSFFDKTDLPLKTKFGVMGKASAECFRNIHGFKPHYIYANSKKSFDQLNKITANKSIVFITALNSQNRFQTELDQHQKIERIICYNNEIKTDFEIPECDTLVFTSPLNAEVYFSKYKMLNHQKVFAIGETTQKKIKELINIDAPIPGRPSIKSLFKFLLKKK